MQLSPSCLLRFAAASSSIHWLARPHLFTLLFLVLFYSALERVRAGQSKYLLALPAATVVWTNLHGGFLVGIVIIGAYGAGELLKMALDPNSATRREASQAARRYFLCAVACLAASLVNPYTYHLHVHMVRVPARSIRLAAHPGISLAQLPPSRLRSSSNRCCCWAPASVFWSFRRRSYVEAVLIVVFAHGALLAARNIPLFSVVAAPADCGDARGMAGSVPAIQRGRVAARRGAQIQLRLGRAYRDRSNRPLARGQRGRHCHCGRALVRAASAQKFPARIRSEELSRRRHRQISRDALGRSVSARIFTYDQWGDYLIYRLYPRIRVFIDGRSDFYGARFRAEGRRRAECEVRLGRHTGPFRLSTPFYCPRARPCRAR